MSCNSINRLVLQLWHILPVAAASCCIPLGLWLRDGWLSSDIHLQMSQSAHASLTVQVPALLSNAF